MDQNTRDQFVQDFRHSLCHQVMPFWQKHGLDREHGGIYTGLDRQGKLIESDKSVWFQGRALWTFSTLYNQVEAQPGWREAAKMCAEFLDQHCFDADGKMFFRVTATGQPVIRRERYLFSECFALMGYAAYAKATADAQYLTKARQTLRRIYAMVESGALVPKVNTDTRPQRGLGFPMIMVNALQELRSSDPDHADEYSQLIRRHIEEMKVFLRKDLNCVLETVGENGAFLSQHFEGRLVNPGHTIEGGWFILQEALQQNDEQLAELGVKFVDCGWDWGWDPQHGGMLYFRDALHHPSAEYWHDMKFWWPQNEAVIANLLAYKVTRAEKYLSRFHSALDWAHRHFPDPQYGEWYGYLHRDGRLSSDIKGNMYKGPFHLPRMYIVCMDCLQKG